MTSARRNVAETISFLQATNPEVFKTKPRAGGLVTIAEPAKTCNDNPPPKKTRVDALDTRASREFRIQAALNESPSDDEFRNPPTYPNPLKDSMYLLGVTFSTVILLASGQSDVLCLDFTESFLNCIRDDQGNHPPNIQGLLNYIQQVKASGPEAQPAQEEPEQTVRTTTRVSMSQSAEGEAPEETAPEEEPQP